MLQFSGMVFIVALSFALSKEHCAKILVIEDNNSNDITAMIYVK